MYRYSNHDEVLNFAIDQLKTYLPQAGNICPHGSDTIHVRVRESLDTIDRLCDNQQRKEITSFVNNTMNDRQSSIDISDFRVTNTFNKVTASVNHFLRT
jgi:hypothetical protein